MPIYLDPLTGKTFAGFGRGNSPVINGFKNQGYYLDRLKDTVGSKFLKEDDTVLIIEFNAFDADYISGKRETDFYRDTLFELIFAKIGPRIYIALFSLKKANFTLNAEEPKRQVLNFGRCKK